MKKLGKLRVQDFTQICNEDQKSLIGGDGPDGWNFMEGPDGNFYYCPGTVYVDDVAPGNVTDLSNLVDMQNSYNVSASGSGLSSVVATVVGSFANGFTALFLAGASIETALYAASQDGHADRLGHAIDQLQSMGYNCESNLRYYNNNGKVKIWDVETGQLLVEYDY
jgi:hypothetical protein